MVKNINTNTSPARIFLKRLFIGIGIVIAVWVLAIVGDFATRPLRDGWDRDKFTQLDRQLQNLYLQVSEASKGLEKWDYKKSCIEELSGPWPTGRYICSAIISTEKEDVTTVDQINALQNKYYPVFDGSSILKPKTELDPQLPNDFGKRFVIGSISRDYTEKSSDVRCRYMLEVNQSIESSEQNTELYGNEITGGIAEAYVALDCSGIARGNWFN